MILNLETVALVNRKDKYPEADATYIKNILIPAYWQAVLQFTNRSWFNAVDKPNDYVQQNPALLGEKIPDDVVVELCRQIDNKLTLKNDQEKARRVTVGQVTIEYDLTTEINEDFALSNVISYYKVPSV